MESTQYEMLTAGLAAHEAGDLSAAESSYREVLKACPADPDVNHALGLLMIALDKPALSVEFLEAALHARPAGPHLWLDYLEALVSQLRLTEAWEGLEQARGLAIDGAKLDQIEAAILSRVSEHNINVS